MKNKDREVKARNTKTIKCTCESEFQDNKYGKNIRVFNRITKKEGGWRCTICGREVFNA